MKIHLFSDLHSQENYRQIIKCDCDIIISCGDLGNNFATTGDYKKRIYVNGNHEYYGTREFPFNSVEVIDDYIFISCTLWSNFWNKKLKDIPTEFIASMINDFGCIEKFRVKDCIECFNRDFNYIKDAVKKYKDKKIIVCTHFAPSKKAIADKYKKGNDIINSYFCNDLDNFIKKNKNIKYWFFGHTHSNHDFKINQCRCVSNQKGYSFENIGFKENLIINIL